MNESPAGHTTADIPVNQEQSLFFSFMYESSTDNFSDYFIYYSYSVCAFRGTGIRGLMRGMATLPQGNQSYYWSETKLEDPR